MNINDVIFVIGNTAAGATRQQIVKQLAEPYEPFLPVRR